LRFPAKSRILGQPRRGLPEQDKRVRSGPFDPSTIFDPADELAGARARIAQLEAELAALKASAHARLALARHVTDERSLLRTLIDNMPDQIYVKDTDGRFVLANTAAADCIGVPAPEDLLGKSDLQLFPGACGQRFHADEQAIVHSGVALIDQLEENINHNGVRRWFSTTKVPLVGDDGAPIGIVGMSRDVTLRVAADEAIGLRNRAIESSLDAIVITSCLNPGNPVVYVNPAFERITLFCFDDAIAGGIAPLIAGEDGLPPEILLHAMREQCEGRAVLRGRRKDGGLFWNDVRVAPVRDIGGRATHFVFTMSDITKARDSEEKLERMASHDALTGLPNRRMLMDRMGQALALAERGGFVVAVAFLDLDRLKFVNDSMGHDAGDELLKSVAARMQACLRKADTVARLGGDEFVLISLHKLDAADGALARACLHIGEMLAKVQKVLAEPLALADTSFSATCSIGVSIYPQDGKSADLLLKQADAAMYLAKQRGRNQIVFAPL
jgi:diguanylate cyclase (GGDEF)-like protein/PAS domain S-box-containing protein